MSIQAFPPNLLLTKSKSPQNLQNCSFTKNFLISKFGGETCILRGDNPPACTSYRGFLQEEKIGPIKRSDRCQVRPSGVFIFTFNPFVCNTKKWSKMLLKSSWCEHCKIFVVSLAIFQH